MKATVAPLALLVLLSPARVSAEITPKHDIALRLDPLSRTLAASDTISLAGSGPVAFTLSARFNVTALSLDGTKAPFERNGESIRLDLGRAGVHEVGIVYEGPLSPFPIEGEKPDLSKPMAGPRGVYLPESTPWSPRAGNTPFSYRISIETAAPFKAVAAGRLMEEIKTAARYRAVFASDRPVGGFVLLAGPYRIKEKIHEGIRIRTYFNPGMAGLEDRYLQSSADYIDRFSGAIGPYPYSAFYVVSGPLTVGLGFPGLTYMSARVLALPFIPRTSLGHEVLHNWWGNAVSLAPHGGDWAEGLTTFMADYAFAGRKGPQGKRSMRLNWLRNFTALPPVRDRPLRSFQGKGRDASQVVGYDKAAFIFHMLENEIGPAAFAKGIGLFWDTWRFADAGWDDLREAFEAASNRGLETFFAQWLERTGGVELKLSGVAAKKKGQGYGVTFTLAQTGPLYEIGIPVSVITEDGTETSKVKLAEGRKTYTLPLKSAPKELAIDGDFDLFRRLDPSETQPILRDVTLAPGVAVLIPGRSEKTLKTARILASRLLDTPAHFIDPSVLAAPSAPLLVIGEEKDVAPLLDRLGVAGAPRDLAGRGTARVWTARRKNGNPVLVVSAESPQALDALLRPLPHYLGKGYLIFEGRKAVETGIRAAASGPLRVRLD